MKSDTIPISVVFLTYNDEQLIEDGLKSVAGWVSEIFVVDSNSTDNTLSIVQKYTDKIVVHAFENYAAQRNWAQDNLPISSEWLFHLDSDERVTYELQNFLKTFFSKPVLPEIDGIIMPRRTVFMGRWIRYGGHYPVYHLRLFRRERGRCEDRLYDQHFTVPGQVVRASGDLVDVISTSLESWTLRHVRWAGLEAQQQLEGHNPSTGVRENLNGTPIERRRWAKSRMFNRAPLFGRAFAYFLYRYVLRLGFLDGTPGLIFHVLQGFWFRFYIDARIWELRHQSDQKQHKR